jgi:transglutaminase-like putative cysteine protease
VTSVTTPTTTTTDPSSGGTTPSVPTRLGLGSFGPLILSASTAAAMSRLIVHASSARVLVPIVVAIVLTDLVTALAVRLRVNVFLATGVGWLIALVGLVLVVDPSLLDPASPHFLHAGLLSGQLRAANSALANDGTPLPRLNGVVIVIGAIGGVAAALTRGAWSLHRHGHPRGHPLGPGGGILAISVAPSLSLFLYSTLVSAEHGRVAAFISYFLGVLIFVALADRAATVPVSTTTPSSASPLPATRRFRSATGAVAGCLLVSLVVIGAGAGLSGMRLTVFHVTPPPPPAHPGQALSANGVPENLVTGIALVDNLRATEITESNTVIFRATSPLATYWQVGTLSSFTGTEWLPTTAASGALAGSTDVTAGALGSTPLPAPSPTQTFTAGVAISDFVSRLLPAPPGTTSVRGLAGAQAIDQQGVLAAAASGPGTDYTVTAGVVTSIPANGSQLAPSDPRLAPYLALPAEPAVVSRLAHQAVGDATTPAAQSQALVDWFRSGRFRYTLSPPATNGPNPLVQFLTVTKAGYCQQFAGAYGVLARSLGIPTRLAVGFTAGTPGANGSYTITGADAHVWPQVYLGPDAGWVSVEPTPPTAGSVTATGVLGTSATSPPPASGSTRTPATATPRTVPGTTPTSVPAPGSTVKAGSRPQRRPAPASRHGLSLWIWLLVLLALLTVATLAGLAWRRRGPAQQVGLQADQRVVRSWERALGALRRTGLARRTGETPGEFARRVADSESASSLAVGSDAVTQLAALVELACYTPRPCTPGQVDHAHSLASMVVDANRRHRRSRQHRRSRPRLARHDAPR